MAPGKNLLQGVLDLAAEFVIDHKGTWEHADWEELLLKAEKLGLELTDECKRNLGNILENLKFFYALMPVPPAKPKAAAKKKSTAR